MSTNTYWLETLRDQMNAQAETWNTDMMYILSQEEQEVWMHCSARLSWYARVLDNIIELSKTPIGM